MNTNLTAKSDGKLLVDIEGGRVLRCDDEVTTTRQFLDSHPFIEQSFASSDVYLAGPDAAHQNRGIGNRGDYVVLEVVAENVTAVTLRRLYE